MKILQQPVKVRRNERIQVTFSRSASVFIMTDKNFTKYKEGAAHRRIGGHFDQSPAIFTAPYDGVWHAVIEKGAHYNAQPMTGSVAVLPPERKEVPYVNPAPANQDNAEVDDSDNNDSETEESTSEEEEEKE